MTTTFTANDVLNKTWTTATLEAMSHDERYALSKACDALLEYGVNENWDKAYDIYTRIDAIESRIYRDENEGKLHEYYAKHIYGHTHDDLRIGNEITYACWDIYNSMDKENRPSLCSAEMDVLCIDAYLKEHNIDREYAKKCCDLSHCWGFYSDYHKDVYGFRPHFM